MNTYLDFKNDLFMHFKITKKNSDEVKVLSAKNLSIHYCLLYALLCTLNLLFH